MSVIKPLKAWKHLVKRPHTIRYPYQEHVDMEGKRLPTEVLRGFHSNDLEKCIGCKMCGMICMNDAISYEEIPELEVEKGKKIRPVIDYGRCCYCGLCAEVCPTGSLKLTPNFKLIDVDREKFRFMPTQLNVKRDDYVVDENAMLFSPEEYKEKVKGSK